MTPVMRMMHIMYAVHMTYVRHAMYRIDTVHITRLKPEAGLVMSTNILGAIRGRAGATLRSDAHKCCGARKWECLPATHSASDRSSCPRLF